MKWARSVFFLPRCKSGYETCTEKVSLFAAPRETDCLKIWCHAIPRKDRVLQSTDYVCEKHFEPSYVTKMWEAVYKGLVLVGAPRTAALAKDAMPTKFPNCPAHLTKTEKKESRLRTVRTLLPPNRPCMIPRLGPRYCGAIWALCTKRGPKFSLLGG
ncbi:hypothetical protein HPB49_008379 [Dermacentor silvarum]|uniref:Uncharacterized protein n=1 Tax=Dermacentor silvarum TaxID=543639 RepID=A0ACB8DXA8_DERSI|nr:hypothetical protein HPB49_008379 [Dermacentor silvarum]